MGGLSQFGIFLSHLSGDEVQTIRQPINGQFLSHLSGDEEQYGRIEMLTDFLSHLSGDEVVKV